MAPRIGITHEPRFQRRAPHDEQPRGRILGGGRNGVHGAAPAKGIVEIGTSVLLVSDGAPPETRAIGEEQRTPADLMLVLCPNPGRASAQSEVMLAWLRPGGILELLSVRAWARALGYVPQELSGKSLGELLPLEQPAGEIVAELLDANVAAPVDVTLCCKDERHKRLRFHRRFDANEEAIFVVADEVSAADG